MCKLLSNSDSCHLIGDWLEENEVTSSAMPATAWLQTNKNTEVRSFYRSKGGGLTTLLLTV